jgi:hypothetical protein
MLMMLIPAYHAYLKDVRAVKDLGFIGSWVESRPESKTERDLYRLWPESTVELYKLPNFSRTMPATPGGSRT